MSLLNLTASSVGAFNTTPISKNSTRAYASKENAPVESVVGRRGSGQIAQDAAINVGAELNNSDTLFVQEGAEVPAIALDTGEPVIPTSSVSQEAAPENITTIVEEKGPIYRPVNEAAAPKYFDGFYLGLTGSLQFQNDPLSVTHQFDGFRASKMETKVKKSSGDIGVLLGFQHAYHSFFFATEGGWTKDYISGGGTGTIDFPGNHPNELPVYTRFEKTYTWRLVNKFGYLFSECFGIYLKVGALNSNFKFEFHAPGYDQIVGPRAKRMNLWGAEVGGGIQYAINARWNFSLDYSYQVYQKFQHDFEPHANNNIDAFTTGNVSPRYHRIGVALHYKF